MATQGSNHAAPRPGAPTSAAIRMGTLAAGALGLTGFALAIICGLAAGNSLAQIIEKALVTTLCLAAVGGVAGAVAGHVIREQIARRIDEIQRKQDEEQQAQADAASARQAAETAGSGKSSGNG